MCALLDVPQSNAGEFLDCSIQMRLSSIFEWPCVQNEQVVAQQQVALAAEFPAVQAAVVREPLGMQEAQFLETAAKGELVVA